MGWPPTVSLHASCSIGDLEDVREVGLLEGRSLLAVWLVEAASCQRLGEQEGGGLPAEVW
jgi:hypothetical protein